MALVWEKSNKNLRKSHKSPFVVILNITLCSVDVNISTVYIVLEKCAVEFVACPFVASRLTIIAALPGTMYRNNTKLGESFKRLFLVLLAVLHVGKSMQ